MSQAQDYRTRAMEFVPPSPEAPFPIEEYDARRARVRAEMARAGVDLLFATSQESVYYLSGYQAIWYQTLSLGGWEPISGIAVQLEADDHIHFECNREQALTSLTTISHDVRIWPLDEGSFAEFILDELKAADWLAGTVGLELSHYRPYPAASARFAAALETAGCTVLDATPIINRVRRNKSPAERACVREAARICDAGMRAALAILRPGITELDVYAEIVHAMSKEGGEHTAIPMPVQSGHRTVAAHALPSRKVIEAGETVSLDVCGVYNRYHADNARTASMGDPGPALARWVGDSAAAFTLLGEGVKPGALINDVLAPLEAHYKAAGLWGGQRWTGGYELGASFAPDWVGPSSYSVGVDNGDATFEVGMVVNYESNFYLPDRPGMSIFIDTILVDEDDAGFVHTIPQELLVIE